MKILFLLTIALLTSSLLRAQKVLIANCEEGGGCTFQLSNVSAEDLGIIVDDKDIYHNTKNGDMVVFGKKQDGTEIVYRESGKSRSQLDREWGGDGYTMIYPFNPALQPMDGKWQATYGNVTGTSCYVDIVSIFKRSLSGNAGKGNITFQKPFTPAQLFPSADMKWRQVSFSKYIGIINFGAGASSPMSMQYTIHIVNERKIESVYDVTIRIPTKGNCKSRIPVTFTLTQAQEDEAESEYEPSIPTDDLLEVKPKDKKEDLLPIEPKSKNKDDLLPIEPGKKAKPKVERIGTQVERLED